MLILLSALYLIVVVEFKPKPRDVHVSALFGLFYAATILPLNVMIGGNYGYLSPQLPDNRTLLNFLGPWPVRPIVMILLGYLALWITYIPWPLLRLLAKLKSRVS